VLRALLESNVSIALRKLRSAKIRVTRFFRSQRFGIPPSTIYDGKFFDGPGFVKTDLSARKISQYLISRYDPDEFLDIGCGRGDYLRYFAESKRLAVGCDGSLHGIARVSEKAIAFQHDLCQPLIFNRKFSVVMCVEVGEHLPNRASETLVISICRNARDVVVFSAAPPGFIAEDHINCRPWSFWNDLFLSYGFRESSRETADLRAFAQDEELPVWWQRWSYILRRNGE
jgi:2-polyprenyl-3-methyl-5-hydroxy-6-metoxy-1,4-benzoquinol methylase